MVCGLICSPITFSFFFSKRNCSLFILCEKCNFGGLGTIGHAKSNHSFIQICNPLRPGYVDNAFLDHIKGGLYEM